MNKTTIEKIKNSYWEISTSKCDSENAKLLKLSSAKTISSSNCNFCKNYEQNGIVSYNAKPRVNELSLERSEVIDLKRKQMEERSFTTFSLEDWNKEQMENLAQFARKIPTEFGIRIDGVYGLRNETDSYSQYTSYISRAFVAGNPDQGFKILDKIENAFSLGSSILVRHPLVLSALSYIFKLLPNEMGDDDRFEISLIRQTAREQRQLNWHQDLKYKVFVLTLACNFEENAGALMSVKNSGKDSPGAKVHMTSSPGNAYLILERNKDSNEHKEKAGKNFVKHMRTAFSTQVANPERITLRILVDTQNQPLTEAI